MLLIRNRSRWNSHEKNKTTTKSLCPAILRLISMRSSQTFDTLFKHGLQLLAADLFRRDFSQRQQHKGTLLHAGMRHAQFRQIHALIGIQHQIHIQRARRVAIGSLPPRRLLLQLAVV